LIFVPPKLHPGEDFTQELERELERRDDTPPFTGPKLSQSIYPHESGDEDEAELTWFLNQSNSTDRVTSEQLYGESSGFRFFREIAGAMMAATTGDSKETIKKIIASGQLRPEVWTPAPVCSTPGRNHATVSDATGGARAVFTDWKENYLRLP
jgi:hypothetical protein